MGYVWFVIVQVVKHMFLGVFSVLFSKRCWSYVED
jgi:hypothetical protein